MKQTNFFNTFFVAVFFASAFATQAQQINPYAFGYYQDYLRFSMSNFGGTARGIGIAGANTAVGGEFSSSASNPAGLGMMRRSEFTITPNVGFASSNSEFRLDKLSPTQLQGLNLETVNAGRNYLNVNNLGFALHINNPDETSAFKGGTFAFSYSRINQFHQKINYRGENPDNSLIDYLLESTNGTAWSVMDNQSRDIYNVQGLGYFTYLINPDPRDSLGGRNQYFSFVPVGKTLQEETIQNKGGQNQFNISYGANFNDVFFFGASLGFQSYNFTNRRTYYEQPLTAQSPLKDFVLQETLTLIGSGANFKVGFIYRPVENFRFGANITTRTNFSVTDTYEATLVAQYNNYPFKEINGKIRVLETESARILPTQFQYNMRTPWRANAGAAYFFGKRGFISADVEYIDYKSGNFTGPTDFDPDNATIKSIYRSVFNYRIGAEIRMKSKYLRGGFAYYADPFNELFDKPLKQDRKIFTLGAGLRRERRYYDLALMMQRSESYYAPYRINDGKNPLVYSKNAWLNIMFTVGFNY
jgi:hypothetical protein